MEIKEFAERVKVMRDLQSQFFKDRSPAVLLMCKTYEKMVDADCAKILSGQGNLL